MNTRWLAYALALLVPLVSGYGCKKSEDGGTTFLRVLALTPEDQQTEVPVETRIGFRANAPIDAASLTTETFFLTDEDGALVPSTVVVGDEADIAELIPNDPLAVITTFTATVTTGIRAAGGATLEEDFEWEFTTLDSEWGISDWLETIGAGNSSGHEIAVDGQLNALAVWQYADASGDSIYANRYTRTDLWGDPERIDDGSGGSSKPQLATDDAGNGFAVWEQREDGGTTVNIWTNRFDVEQGWPPPELLQTDEVTAARTPAVAADPAGNAIAIWVQSDMEAGGQLIWARRYEPGTGWGAAASIDEVDGSSLLAGTHTAVGMDANGNATAIWLRPTIDGQVIWTNRYTLATGWGTAELIKSDPNTDARDPRLAVGANGDAFVIWGQNEGARQDIWAARFSGAAWESPEWIDAYDGGNKQESDIAVDGMGIAHAVWGQADDDDPDLLNLWASQYTPGSGWGTPELIEPPNEDPNEDGPVRNARVGVNTAGNAFVVWAQAQGNWLSIWSNRLDPGTGWMTAEPIEIQDLTAKLPKIAVDENRHAHAVWLHSPSSGIDRVRTNRFE